MNVSNTGPQLTPGSEISQDQTSDIPKIQYNGILVPHDGTEKSDKGLGHAIYLSKLSGAEIIILNVEHVKNTDSSALIATSKVQQPDSANAKLEVTIYGGVKTMVEEKIRLCKQAGVKSQISTRKPPVDEIINVAQVMKASSRITSSIKVHGSTTRK